jgi:hypothetical protein
MGRGLQGDAAGDITGDISLTRETFVRIRTQAKTLSSVLRVLGPILIIVLALAAPASAQGPPAVAADVPIGAYGGWIVWSAPGPGGWQLMTLKEGAMAAVAVATRPDPFDVDLGTDARGRLVATYSRCSPTGRSCRVHVLDLASGVETVPAIRRPARASDRWPSMWRGRIAFARSDPRHKKIDQVMLWSPRTRHLRRLPHGAIPSSCPFRGGCSRSPVSGTVQGIDLGTDFAAFLWWIVAPSVIGHGGWEVRADRLSDGRRFLVGSGYVGEACAGGPDVAKPSAPSVDGRYVWYSMRISECYVNRNWAIRFDPVSGAGRRGRLAEEVQRFFRTPEALYGLVAPRPLGEDVKACEAPDPCEIRRIGQPALNQRIRRPRSPFS